jgi:hypothetical protein
MRQLTAVVKRQGADLLPYRYLPLNTVPCGGPSQTLQSGFDPDNRGTSGERDG